MNIKTFALFLLYSVAIAAHADSVKPQLYSLDEEDNSTNYLYVYQTSTGASLNTLVTEYSDSTSNVYVPIAPDAARKESSNVVDVDQLSNGTSDESYIKINLNVTTTTATTYYLTAIYEHFDSPGTYKATPLTKTMIPAANATSSSDYYSFTSAGTDQTVTAYLNIKNICEGDCTPSTTSKAIKVYFFLHQDTHRGSLEVMAPGDYAGGSTVQFNFSNQVPNYVTTLDPLRKGDGRLIGRISSSSITDGYRVINYFTKNADHEGDTYANLKLLRDSVDSYQQGTKLPFTYSGDVVFENLENGITYSFAVALINKYQFSTIPSSVRSGQAESIETFLKSQQCYLLSAGFQEEHYVIEYFKGIRDQYLLKSWAGSKFVQFYYWSAPKFTRYIYESSILSAFFRGFGYTLYFIFHYYLLILTFIISIISLIFFRKKRAVRKSLFL